jgi:hypothetical protein
MQCNLLSTRALRCLKCVVQGYDMLPGQGSHTSRGSIDEFGAMVE